MADEQFDLDALRREIAEAEAEVREEMRAAGAEVAEETFAAKNPEVAAELADEEARQRGGFAANLGRDAAAIWDFATAYPGHVVADLGETTDALISDGGEYGDLVARRAEAIARGTGPALGGMASSLVETATSPVERLRTHPAETLSWLAPLVPKAAKGSIGAGAGSTLIEAQMAASTPTARALDAAGRGAKAAARAGLAFGGEFPFVDGIVRGARAALNELRPAPKPGPLPPRVLPPGREGPPLELARQPRAAVSEARASPVPELDAAPAAPPLDVAPVDVEAALRSIEAPPGPVPELGPLPAWRRVLARAQGPQAQEAMRAAAQARALEQPWWSPLSPTTRQGPDPALRETIAQYGARAERAATGVRPMPDYLRELISDIRTRTPVEGPPPGPLSFLDDWRAAAPEGVPKNWVGKAPGDVTAPDFPATRNAMRSSGLGTEPPFSPAEADARAAALLEEYGTGKPWWEELAPSMRRPRASPGGEPPPSGAPSGGGPGPEEMRAAAEAAGKDPRFLAALEKAQTSLEVSRNAPPKPARKGAADRYVERAQRFLEGPWEQLSDAQKRKHADGKRMADALMQHAPDESTFRFGDEMGRAANADRWGSYKQRRDLTRALIDFIYTTRQVTPGSPVDETLKKAARRVDGSFLLDPERGTPSAFELGEEAAWFLRQAASQIDALPRRYEHVPAWATEGLRKALPPPPAPVIPLPVPQAPPAPLAEVLTLPARPPAAPKRPPWWEVLSPRLGGDRGR